MKPHKEANNNKITIKDIYAKAKKDSIDFYVAEMDELFVGSGSVYDDEFEEHHRKSRRTAWAMFKCLQNADKLVFKKYQTKLHHHINGLHTKYKQINQNNRDEEVDNIPDLTISKNQTLITNGIKKTSDSAKYLPELESKATCVKLETMSLKLVS